MADLEITLSYVGGEADSHELDFYDAAIALIGFQRSLAHTAHFVINNEIITQAPALKGARILAIPPEAGSWKIKAGVVAVGAAAIFKLGTAPTDTPIGNLVSSAYDYVVASTLGFHVDYSCDHRRHSGKSCGERGFATGRRRTHPFPWDSNGIPHR